MRVTVSREKTEVRVPIETHVHVTSSTQFMLKTKPAQQIWQDFVFLDGRTALIDEDEYGNLRLNCNLKNLE